MTLRDVDVEYTFDDPDDGWFGSAQPGYPTPSHVSDLEPFTEMARPEVYPVDSPEVAWDDSADTDSWYVPLADPHYVDELPQDQAPALDEVEVLDPPPIVPEPMAPVTPEPSSWNEPRIGSERFTRPAAPSSYQSRVSNSGAWDFKSSHRGQSRRPMFLALAAVVAAIAVASGVFFLLRSPVPAVQDSTPATPSPSSAAPAPTGPAAPTAIDAPAPPPPVLPPPPPPPPPPADQIDPPAARQYTPRYEAPQDQSKPQTNVTRAPMSVAPPPPPPNPQQNSATPGDGPKRRHFGF